jgi:hypothetical protein
MTIRTGLLVMALLGGPRSLALAGPFDDAIQTVPPSANVIALVNVKGLIDSPVGKKAGWAGRLEERARSGIGLVPPNTERLLVAGQLNLAGGAWTWKAAVLEGAGLPTIGDVVPSAKADADELDGYPVALSPRGVYFVGLKPGERLAVFQPTNRQALGRWTAHLAGGEKPAKYIADAVKATAANQVVIALDLTHAIDPVAAREIAAALFSVVDKGVDPAAFGKFLSRARGVTFTARATDTGLRGSLRLDFSDNPLKFEKLLRAAVVETLAGAGAELPDIAKWQTSFGEYSFTMSGSLAPESLEQVLGTFSFPQVGEPKGPAAPSGPATRRYIDSVRGISEDVRKLAQTSKPEKTVLWHETGAKKIEHLDPRGVDPEAMKYGLEVAGRLKAIAGSLRGVPIDLDRLARSMYAIEVVRPFGWWWGGTDFQTNVPEVRNQMAKVIADDQKNRQQLWTQIESSYSAVRQKLAAKYPDF